MEDCKGCRANDGRIHGDHDTDCWHVSLGVAIAPFISISIILTVGLIIASVTAYTAYRDIQQQKPLAAEQQVQQQNIQETNTQMMDRMQHLENNVVELKSGLNNQTRLAVEPKAKMVDVADSKPRPFLACFETHSGIKSQRMMSSMYKGLIELTSEVW